MKIQILVLFIVFLANTLLAQNVFQEAFENNNRSTIESFHIDFSDSLGNSIKLPISLIKGKNEGPVFTIVAGVHGYEYPPIIAVQKFMKEIDVKELSGTIIILPIANLGSFYNRTPFINPMDRKNLNNAFPGKSNSSVTDQIANFITNNIISISDVFLDVHGGDACEDLIPFVCYYNDEEQLKQTSMAKKLSENSGFQYVVSYPYNISSTEPAKYAFKQAVQDGKIALSIECGKLGNVQEENVELIVSGIYNMLSTINMHPTETRPHNAIIYRNSQDYIKSSVQGIFYSNLKAGDSVKQNQRVGHTTDEFGNIIEEYTSPKDGIILYKLATPPINIDDTVMCISSYEND